MAVRPNPYKLVCPNCGYSKVVSPKSDCLSPKDLMNISPICPKCKRQMERKDLDKKYQDRLKGFAPDQVQDKDMLNFKFFAGYFAVKHLLNS